MMDAKEDTETTDNNMKIAFTIITILIGVSATYTLYKTLKLIWYLLSFLLKFINRIFQILLKFLKPREVKKSKSEQFEFNSYENDSSEVGGSRYQKKHSKNRPGRNINKSKDTLKKNTRNTPAISKTSSRCHITTLKALKSGVNGFSWSFDGSHLIIGCEDETVTVIRFKNFVNESNKLTFNVDKQITDIGLLDNTPKFVILSPGNTYNTSSLIVCELPSFPNISKHTELKSQVVMDSRPLKLHCFLSTAGSRLHILCCSKTEEARVFDADLNLVCEIKPKSLLNNDIAVSADGRFISVATFTSDAKVWEMEWGKDNKLKSCNKVMDLTGHKSKITTVAFSKDGKKAMSCSEDRTLKIWNLDVRYRENQDPRCLIHVPQEVPEGQSYHLAAYSAGGCIAAAFGNSIHLIDDQTGKVTNKIENAHSAQITALKWSPVPLQAFMYDEKIEILASASNDKLVKFWTRVDQ